MSDPLIKEAIRVRTAPGTGPYILTTVDQIPWIRERLNRHPIVYWVDTHSISLDGKPATRGINFSRAEDAAKIQAILDEHD